MSGDSREDLAGRLVSVSGYVGHASHTGLIITTAWVGKQGQQGLCGPGVAVTTSGHILRMVSHNAEMIP